MTPRRPARMVWGLVVSMAYAGTIVAANLATCYWPNLSILALSVPAGTLFAGLTFTLRDLLHEVFGPRGVLIAITVGTLLSWGLASPRIAAASVTAFAVSELVDSIVYGRLRLRSRLAAVVGSNLGGLLVDTVLFVPMAFGSFAAVPGQLLGKLAATVLTAAVMLIASAARRAARR